MKRDRVVRLVKFLPIFLAGMVAFGFVVMALWNALLPPILGAGRIGFWQALGLFVLSRILFGSFGGGDGHRRRRKPCAGEELTPDERERLLAALRPGPAVGPEPSQG